MTKKAIYLLRQVKKQILEHPEIYNQFQNPENGNAGCIAFHLRINSNLKWDSSVGIIQQITESSFKLCYDLGYCTIGEVWTRQLSDIIENTSPGTIKHAKAGAKAIENFIKLSAKHKTK